MCAGLQSAAPTPHFAPTELKITGLARCYKHRAPLERKTDACCLQVESTGLARVFHTRNAFRRCHDYGAKSRHTNQPRGRALRF